MAKKHDIFARRTTYKPFMYPEFFEIYQTYDKSHWRPEESSMQTDITDWQTKLTDNDKAFLTKIFRFFTQGDIDVCGAYATKFLPTFHHPEIRMMLASFAAREATHIESYAYINDTLAMPDTIYSEFLAYTEMVKKHEYFNNIMRGDKLSWQMAGVSLFTEGMQLFSSFVMLMNYGRHGLMNGMNQIITWSMRDEDQHCLGMTALFRHIMRENKELWTIDTRNEIEKMCIEMTNLEDAFIDLSFEHNEQRDLKKDDVKEYIRYIADRRLIGIGMKGVHKVKDNPLPWVQEIANLPEHTDFFKAKPTAYAKGATTGDWSDVFKFA